MGSGGSNLGAVKEAEVLAELVRIDGNLETLDKEVGALEERFESVLIQSSPSSKTVKEEGEPIRQTKLGVTLQGKNRRLQDAVDAIRNIRSRCEL